MKRPFIRQVRIENYRSLAQCDLMLGPFTLLVGPNGAGKSNFLDALRFITDALRATLEQAVRNRGGIDQVRRLSVGHPRNFSLAVSLDLGDGGDAEFLFRIGARPNGGFRVQREHCEVTYPAGDKSLSHVHYDVEDGILRTGNLDGLPSRIEPDRLYLGLVSALPGLRPVYDVLSRLGFYNLNPDRIRDLQDPNPGELLARDGSNLASVVRRLREDSPQSLERIVQYLQAIVPGIHAIRSRTVLSKETLEFDQDVVGAKNPWHFRAASMSDGTLRALGVLVAMFQGAGNQRNRPIPLIGIEEPEVAIHPGAAAKLMDALREATHWTQVLVTTHSPELLDHEDLDPDQIFAVEAIDGSTVIGHVEKASRRAIRDKLYTAGELLRMAQMAPSEETTRDVDKQLKIFGPQ